MNSTTRSPISSFVLRAVAMAMAAATIVLTILGTVATDDIITLLSIGLFSLALEALQHNRQ